MKMKMKMKRTNEWAKQQKKDKQIDDHAMNDLPPKEMLKCLGREREEKRDKIK